MRTTLHLDSWDVSSRCTVTGMQTTCLAGAQGVMLRDAYLAGVHDLLSHINFPKSLEEGCDGHFQALARGQGVPLSLLSPLRGAYQLEHPDRQLTIDHFLHPINSSLSCKQTHRRQDLEPESEVLQIGRHRCQ